MDYTPKDISLCARLLKEGMAPEEALLTVKKGNVYVVLERDDYTSSPRLYEVHLREGQAKESARKLSINGKVYHSHDVHIKNVSNNVPMGRRSPARLKEEDRATFFRLAAEQIIQWDLRLAKQPKK